MAVSRTIPHTEKADVVTCAILVNGAELSRAIPLLSIDIKKEVNKIPLARVRIGDGDPSLGDFPLSNREELIPGNEIEIRIGYRNDNNSLFRGIIVSHSNKISARKAELLIECRDKAVKLTIGKKNKHFENLSNAEIAEEIIARYGLESEIESTGVRYKEAVQFNTSDWDFMLSRMDRTGRICLVEDGKIILKKPDLSAPAVLDLLFGATIIDYQAEIDAREQLAHVKARSWDYSNQELAENTSDEPEAPSAGNLSPASLSEITGPEEYLLPGAGKAESAVLKEWANARTLKSRLSKVRGHVRFQGFREVKPGDFITINGVGERFTGPVFVSAVRQEYAGGNWHTTVNFGMPGEWFSEQLNPFHLSAQSGWFPSVQGLQTGIVTDLEDPEGEFRVKVRLPLVNPAEEGLWMRVATLDAGNARGTFFRPELGDEVIAGFLHNDPDHPVILGMLHSSALAAPLTASNANPEKGYVSREGIKMIFHDADRSLTLETPAGKKITLDDSAGAISVEDEHGNSIRMEAAGITIDSAASLNLKAAADIKLEAVNILLSPSSQFGVSAGASEITAGGGSAEIKSASVKINGAGLTEIKGGLVKIN
ncbi:Rhs element Vgr protein [Anseongella ginsenosidimutans]|uniref:Rhs element Vgr protein n=1 Tax=Anseongella ginsenosidimutans TaxID=496056 RepID=A0A4R3KQG9_9SPHI|nr:type VI secretion system tip protein VgrG [Anseongella ginsenosidimutans]QEC53861.1 type VI secretion system tip protein VgrG [Anseongella ginsenosidimutans]TCS86241.1 Rhs element Vgr protein [Anseongella ginsenosidimutans]